MCQQQTIPILMPAKVCLHLWCIHVTIILEVGTALQLRMRLHKQADAVTAKYVRGDENYVTIT